MSRTMAWTLGQLRTFAAVAELGTMTAAARRLGYTTGAVSQHMSALQRVVRVPLLAPAGRRLVLTEAGRALLPRAQAIIAAESRAAEAVAGGALGGRSQVTLGVFGSASVVAFARAHSLIAAAGIDLRAREVDVEHMQEAVLTGRIDLGIGVDYPSSPLAPQRGVVMRTVCEERFHVVARADPGPGADPEPGAASAEGAWAQPTRFEGPPAQANGPGGANGQDDAHAPADVGKRTRPGRLAAGGHGAARAHGEAGEPADRVSGGPGPPGAAPRAPGPGPEREADPCLGRGRTRDGGAAGPAASALDRPAGASVADLAAQLWILPPNTSTFGRAVRFGIAELGIAPREAHIVTDSAVTLAMVGEGMGVSLATPIMMSLAPPTVGIVPGSACGGRRIVVMTRPQAAEQPAVARVAEALAEVFA